MKEKSKSKKKSYNDKVQIMDESLEHLEPQSSHKFDAMSSGESSQLQREVMEDA